MVQVDALAGSRKATTNRLAASASNCLALCSLALFSLTLIPLAGAQASSLTTLYSFTGVADGGTPTGGVVRDSVGNLYGETSTGGAAVCTSAVGQPSKGCGTVYSLNSVSGLKVLASFSGPNGAYGTNTLTLVGSTLYGTTANGGASDNGVVFSIKTNGSGFTLLHQFNGSDGSNPVGVLRAGAGGVFYGITKSGGSSNKGILFSLKSDGAYSVLHNFAGGKDGALPLSLLIEPAELVGSTNEGGSGANKTCVSGCGSVFEYVFATGSYSVSFAFTGVGGFGGEIGAIGAGPTVYGDGGPSPYALSQASGLVDIGPFPQSFAGSDVSGPLLAPNGTLFGVNGPGPQSVGSLYSTANGVTTFLAGLDYPVSQPILISTGALIGTSSQGGLCTPCGIIWEYTP